MARKNKRKREARERRPRRNPAVAVPGFLERAACVCHTRERTLDHLLLQPLRADLVSTQGPDPADGGKVTGPARWVRNQPWNFGIWGEPIGRLASPPQPRERWQSQKEFMVFWSPKRGLVLLDGESGQTRAIFPLALSVAPTLERILALAAAGEPRACDKIAALAAEALARIGVPAELVE